MLANSPVTSRPYRFAETLHDLAEGLQHREMWQTFAWDEIQSRYRRSSLGLYWIAVSYLMLVGSISVFFGGFSRMDGGAFIHYVAVGFATFSFLRGNMAEGCAVFRGAASWIQSSSMPMSVYVYKSVARSLFPFTVQMAVCLVILLVTGWRPTVHIMLLVLTIPVFVQFSIGLQLAFGYIGARFRDFQHFIQSIQRLLLFMTPVLWVFEEREGIVRDIALFNPFVHLIEIFRAPILGQMPMKESLIAVPIILVTTWAVAVLVSARMRNNLPFWV